MNENLYQTSKAAKRMTVAKELRAGDYKGKKKWLITNPAHGVLQIFAPNMAAAIYAAGHHWGVNPKKAEFHQGCSVREW